MGAVKQALLAEQESRQLVFDFDKPNNVRKPSDTQRLAKLWLWYAKTNKLNPKSKKYHDLQHAFLCGIDAGLEDAMPPILKICLMSGRDVASIVERTQPR